MADLAWIHVTETRLWFGFDEIPYPNDIQGWVVRDLASDTLLVSVSARSDDDHSVHLWGHFPVDDTIGYP